MPQRRAVRPNPQRATLKKALKPAADDAAKVGGFFDIFKAQNPASIAILTVFIILVTMVCGPIAAMLAKLCPTRIRYSGLSLPCHVGNGWFGGLLPATAFAISAKAGNICAGLRDAVIIAGVTAMIGTIFVPNGTPRKSIFTGDQICGPPLSTPPRGTCHGPGFSARAGAARYPKAPRRPSG